MTTVGAAGSRRAAGAHRLVEHNCPIQQVAVRFPEVCEAEAQFLAAVLGAQVTRETHIASGCGTCEYTVTNSVAGRESRFTSSSGRLPVLPSEASGSRLETRDSRLSEEKS